MFFKKPNKPRFFKWVTINTEIWRSFDIADFIWYSAGEKLVSLTWLLRALRSLSGSNAALAIALY